MNDEWVVPRGSLVPSNPDYHFGDGFLDHSSFDGPSFVWSYSSISGDDWMAIVDEDFNNPTLDETVWFSRVGWSNDDALVGGDPNIQSLQIPENLSIANGVLHIRGKYDNDQTKMYDLWLDENNKAANQIHRDYTSGSLCSRYQFPINSRYQIRYKAFPDPNWNSSALWLWYASSAHPGNTEEIDIIENLQNPHDPNTADEPERWQSMGLHGSEYGSGNNPQAEYMDDLHDDLTASMHQFDLIWDKWKIDWYFDGTINRRVCQYYYCPSDWTQCHLYKNMRQYSIGQYSDMQNVSGGDNNFAYLKSYPSHSNMSLVMGLAIRNGAPSAQYTASNTLDIDYVKVWLRTNCNANFIVHSLNYGEYNVQYGGSAFEMGKTVSTDPAANIIIQSYHKGIFAATDEVALLDGFVAESNSNFHAFITYCQPAWDQRVGNNMTNSTNNPINQSIIKSSNQQNSITYTTNAIIINSEQNNYISYELYDAIGSLIEKAVINALEINLNKVKFPNGIYYIRLQKENGFDTKKLLIQN